MKLNKNLARTVSEVNQLAGRTLTIDEPALQREYQNDLANEGTISMQILSLLGAMASMAMLAIFLFLSELYRNETVVFIIGVTLMVAGYLLCRRNDASVQRESFGVGLSACGYGMTLFTVESYVTSFPAFCLLAIGLAVFLLVINDHKIVVFLATVASGLWLLALLFDLNDTAGASVHVVLFTLSLLGWAEGERFLLATSRFWNRRYDAVRTGLIVCLLAGAFMLSYQGPFLGISGGANWYASLILVPATLWVARSVLNRHVRVATHRMVYLTGILLLLLPTFFAPALVAALFVLLVSWRAGYHTGTVLGLVALILALIRYYYDLDLTLLAKSGVLVLSGTLFLVAYFLLFRKFTAYETADQGTGGR